MRVRGTNEMRLAKKNIILGKSVAVPISPLQTQQKMALY
jgi:hypothetical protein